MKALALAISIGLLLLATGVVLAQGNGGRDWLDDMGRHHYDMHGDNWEEHMQGMHGDDWRGHVAVCHRGVGPGKPEGQGS